MVIADISVVEVRTETHESVLPISVLPKWSEADDDEDDCWEVPEIAPDEVVQLLADPTHSQQVLILDVRTPCEFTCERIPDALLVPLSDLPQRHQELDSMRPIVCVCGKGIRSVTAARLLAENGFTNVVSMRGGMVRYRGPVLRGYCPDAPENNA